MNPGTSPTRRLVLAAAGTLLVPRCTRAQPAKRRRIAFFDGGSRASLEPFLGAFRQGLRALGYRDEDIAIEERYADGQAERLPDLAAELAHLAPEVIVAGGLAVYAAKQATATIPIVMAAFGGDPVASGLVASLGHPGSNLTGLSGQGQELAGKRLQLLKTVIPDAERIAILVNPGAPGQAVVLEVARQAAATLRIKLLSVEVRAPDEIDGAFAIMMRERAEGVIVPGGPLPLFGVAASRIVELAASYKLPAIHTSRGFVAIGGLMSYGPDPIDLFRRAASYVDKILKGAKPPDLPVEQPTKFLLAVNLKTARALGLTIPPAILAGADEVIE